MGKALSGELSCPCDKSCDNPVWLILLSVLGKIIQGRVVTVREKYLENDFFSRSGKSQGILWMAREI